MTFGATLGEYVMMAASGKMFYIAIDYNNKTYMEVVTSKIHIKIHHLFAKQRIIAVRVHHKISGHLIQTCF